jgi:hypothetical protein
MEEYFSCLIGYVVQTNCRMTLTETISGDCKSLFLFLLSKVKQKLKFSTIILPRGFEFKIPKQSFSKKESMFEEFILKQKPQTKTDIKKNLSYSRSNLLSELLVDIEEEDE